MTRPSVAQFIKQGYQRFLDAQQVRMSSNNDGLLLLSILALFCGLISGGAIIIFRLFIESATGFSFTGGDIEGFEQLSKVSRFFLCVIGALIVGLILHFLKPRHRDVGVVHVIERLEYHQGRLPLKNALLQFVAGSISLLSGQSIGKEGPSIHLGAAGGSLLGRFLKVPNNGLRILVACGVSAAIAAAFNTPLAGVIFAMEVVILDYSFIGFTPVIISAVSSAALTRIIFGNESFLFVPTMEVLSIYEIPLVALMGAMIGCIAAAFIQLTILTNSLFIKNVIWKRTLLAGVITGVVAIYLPQVMGTGYDTVNHVLLAQIGLAGVVLLTMAKVITTSAAIGLGIPAGLIGPCLFIGASAGAAFGLIVESFQPGSSNPGTYAMLGMAAMMASTLQAPLAALIYLLELTTNQSIILPGMTAVIIAALVTRVVFGKSSIYRHLMLIRGIDYRNTPMSKALRRIGVASVMERDFVQHINTISFTNVSVLLKDKPKWILINNDVNEMVCILPAADLANHVNELQLRDQNKPIDEDISEDISQSSYYKEIDMLKIPAKRLDISSVSITASLQEAHSSIQEYNSQIVCVTGSRKDSKKRVYGLITEEHIENSYKI